MKTAAILGGAAVTLAAAPAVTAISPLRRRVAPRLSGISQHHPHIALTFDDGPDPVSTPVFLDLLGTHDRRATFFLLGAHARANAPLLKRMVAEGHELAVHGWTHRCTLRVPPTRLVEQMRTTKQIIEDLGGTPVTWYRPPYGVLSAESIFACRSVGLTPVLWTAWGREWERSATPSRVAATVLRTLRLGGTILLHDTDQHALHGNWRRTMSATAALLAGPLATLPVGPLREHWPDDVQLDEDRAA